VWLSALPSPCNVMCLCVACLQLPAAACLASIAAHGVTTILCCCAGVHITPTTDGGDDGWILNTAFVEPEPSEHPATANNN